MDDVQDEQSITASAQIGSNLRSIRKEKKLSLQRIEKISNNEFKASVVGAYERGERSISVACLIRLCYFYEVSPSDVLEKNEEIDLTKIEVEITEKVKVDLTKLQDNTHAEAMVVAVAGVPSAVKSHNEAVIVVSLKLLFVKFKIVPLQANCLFTLKSALGAQSCTGPFTPAKASD